MASFNKVILMGNLTRDCELRYTPKGTAVVAVGLALNRKWKDEGGNDREEVTFVDVTAFGRTAENMSQYLHKGSPVHIEGRLKLDQWDDKQTNQKRQKLSVVVETCQFLYSANQGEHADSGQRPEFKSNLRSGRTQTAPPPEDEPPEAEDDVPF